MKGAIKDQLFANFVIIKLFLNQDAHQSRKISNTTSIRGTCLRVHHKEDWKIRKKSSRILTVGFKASAAVLQLLPIKDQLISQNFA